MEMRPANHLLTSHFRFFRAHVSFENELPNRECSAENGTDGSNTSNEMAVKTSG